MITEQELNLLHALRTDLDTIKAEIVSMKVNGDQALSVPGQFPGRGLPARIGAEIDFDGTTRKHQINIIVPPDGPFHATSISFAWRRTVITQPNYTQTWGSISSIENLSLTTGVLTLLDFYWEYKVTGSERKRQNIPVPSSMVLRTETGMGSFPLIPHDVFQAVSTIIIEITPTFNINTITGGTNGRGKIWAGFNGFYSLN